MPPFEPGIECAVHFHTLVQIHQAAFARVARLCKFVFIVALFQCIQISILFNVSKDGVHHDAGFVIGYVRNHGVLRDGFIDFVQDVVYVILNVGFNIKCAKLRLSHGVIGWL